MPFVTATHDKIAASVKRVVDDVAKGVLVIPEAQRDFIKDEGWIAELVNSVQCGMPIGSLLVWKPGRDQQVATRNGGVIEGKPPLLVVDGLQRLTTLCLMYGVKAGYLTDRQWERMQDSMVPEIHIPSMLDDEPGPVDFGNTSIDEPVAWPWLRLPQLLKGDPAIFTKLSEEISTRVALGETWATVDEAVTPSDVNDRWVEPIRTAFGSTGQDLDIVTGSLRHATEAAGRRNAKGTAFTDAQWARMGLANATTPGFLSEHVDPLLNMIDDLTDVTEDLAEQDAAVRALGLTTDNLLLTVHGMASTDDDPRTEPDRAAVERIWREVGPGLVKLSQVLRDLQLPVVPNLMTDKALVWCALAAEHGLLDEDLLRRAALNGTWRASRSRVLRVNARDAYRSRAPETILADISQEGITAPQMREAGDAVVGIDLLSRSVDTNQSRAHGALLAWAMHVRDRATPDPLTGQPISDPVLVPLLTSKQVKAAELTYQNARSELASEAYADADAILNYVVVESSTAEKLAGTPPAKWSAIVDVPADYWQKMGISPKLLVGVTPSEHRALLHDRRARLLTDATVGFSKLEQ